VASTNVRVRVLRARGRSRARRLAATFSVALTLAPEARADGNAILVDVTTGFVPYANDVPIMVGAGVRFADIHEGWGRFGYMPNGDDVGHAFGVAGYRAVFRPGRVVRPFLGGLAAGLPATCGHDRAGRPDCTSKALFIFAATGGLRFEPAPWLGLSVGLSLGTDTYPNPFGMVEVGSIFALPLP
jgi:hypothetical protein